MQRVITAVVLMLALVAATTLLSPYYFALLIAAVILLASLEWSRLIGLQNPRSKLGYLVTMTLMLVAAFPLLGVTPTAERIDDLRALMVLSLGLLFWLAAFAMLRGYPGNAEQWDDKSKIATMSMFALIPTWAGIVELKYLMPEGYLVIALVIMVAAVDIGGYFVGRKLGHRKLAPALSPNKSWEGVWGGLVACVLLGIVLIWSLGYYRVALTPLQVCLLFLLSLNVTLFDVIGDLTVSMLKRNRKLKDAGNLLPGHGGIMDRVDGLVAVTPIFTLVIIAVLVEVR